MPDLYSNITAVPNAVIGQLIDILEMRAAEPRQQEMRDDYLGRMRLPAGARVLEIGCGTGAVCRALAGHDEVVEVTGIDPCPSFVEAARRLSDGVEGASFAVGDARDLAFDDGEFDAVVAHTVLSHLPRPDQALAEARRVLRCGGVLAVFDGDYNSTTVANGPHDPLQACVEAAVSELVFDPYLIRRLRAMVEQEGFVARDFRTHSYLDCCNDGYLATFAHRGAGFLQSHGRISAATCEALQAEIYVRLQEGRAFGHILYGAMIACKL